MQVQNDESPTSPAASIHKCGVGINLLAACISKAWYIIVLLVCTPYLVRVLGPDGFGLVGIYLTLQRLSALLDSGLSTTINKEMAFHGKQSDSGRLSDMLRTLEIVYWAISFLVFVIIAALSKWIASEWISNDRLGEANVQWLVLVMALAIAVQLPQSFYSAALAGQERHVTLNIIQIFWHGVRFLGVIPVLMLVAASPLIFFQWQVVSGIVITAATAAAIWTSLPRFSRRPRFCPLLLRETLRFAAGAGTFTISAVIISQMDKVVLSKQLSSEQFGYYMLAYSIPSALFVICSSIQTVIFPRLARHIGNGDRAGLTDTYHFGSQLTLLAIAPIAITGAFFSTEIFDAWLYDSEVAEKCSLIASILFCGIGLNCLSSMPHSLQMAHGWTGLANSLNLASVVVFGPILVVACSLYGSIGASLVWVIYAVCNLLLQIRFMHRRLLPEEKAQWVLNHAVPITLCMCVVIAARQLLHPANRISMLACIASTWLMCFCLAAAASPTLRRNAFIFWSERKRCIRAHDANRGTV
jgi:O-antigen/teichoic acid export membrane protein